MNDSVFLRPHNNRSPLSKRSFMSCSELSLNILAYKNEKYESRFEFHALCLEQKTFLGGRESPEITPRSSRTETWEPKRGSLKSAGKQHESATFQESCNASFSILQSSFSLVAVQLLVK